MEKERKTHSIRTKITLLTACAVIVALGIATAIGIVAIRNQGSRDADETITLMCRTGQLNLNSYFEDVKQSVNTVSTLVQESLEDASYDQLNDQVERAQSFWKGRLRDKRRTDLLLPTRPRGVADYAGLLVRQP